ncbi:hypothetical protein K443DRAFT_679650, partial [Laccaria amethystina LaAM-08-1]
DSEKLTLTVVALVEAVKLHQYHLCSHGLASAPHHDQPSSSTIDSSTFQPSPSLFSSSFSVQGTRQGRVSPTWIINDDH